MVRPRHPPGAANAVDLGAQLVDVPVQRPRFAVVEPRGGECSTKPARLGQRQRKLGQPSRALDGAAGHVGMYWHLAALGGAALPGEFD